MLNGYIIASSISAVIIALLSLFVFLRNPKAGLNRSFLFFGFLMAIWLIVNYLGGTPSITHNIALIANRLTFFFGCAVTFCLYLFAIFLGRSKLGRFGRVLSVLNAVAILLSATPAVVSGIKATEATYTINFGWASDFYFAILLANVVATMLVLLKARRHNRGYTRTQINTVLQSFAIFLFGVITTNAILPFLLGYYGLTNAGALFSFILIGGMAYAITKHRLFDLRLVVARALGYALSLVSLSLLFIVGTFAVTSVFFKHTQVNAISTRWGYTILAVALAFTFAPLKRFFDKTTNRIFFRDTYDSQVFLDQFNKVLVSNYELNSLLIKSAEIIETNLSPAFCLFLIPETENTARKLVGTANQPKLTDSDISALHRMVPRISAKIINADTLAGTHSELKKILLDKNIGVIAQLTSDTQNDNRVGYLILGTKKSGNLYSNQDNKMVEILTNELVIAIQNSLRFEEIENFTITLQDKVNNATRKLRATNEKLRELDEAKDDFVSMASHQLRTPLTSIKGYTSMVLEGDAGKINATQRRLLEQSFTSSQRMVYLIADLLNVSRLKTGKFIIEPAPVNLADLVQQEIGQLTEVAASRSLTLTFQKPESFPTLLLDETKTRQVVMNFVDNAIYYTPSGGRISVQLVETPASVELRVVDDGIGVPKSEQPHLFTKFYRAGNARKARPDGTGLGLFMAKKVIVAEGGAIIFETVEGQGSTFGFVFSKTKLAPPVINGLPMTTAAAVEVAVKA